ncbi:MAG: hypothetical protein WC052_04895 [Patescibacteria group bacterium]
MGITKRAKKYIIVTNIVLALRRRHIFNTKKSEHSLFLSHLRISASIAVLVGLFYGPMTGIAAAPSLSAIEADTKEAAVAVEREFKAVITQYSYADSCHNIRKGKCLMASGRAVYVGAAACPMSLKLGTQVVVAGVTYTCEDRYAKWLDDMRPHPTIDIFVSSNPRGRSTATVSVLAPTIE